MTSFILLRRPAGTASPFKLHMPAIPHIGSDLKQTSVRKYLLANSDKPAIALHRSFEDRGEVPNLTGQRCKSWEIVPVADHTSAHRTLELRANACPAESQYPFPQEPSSSCCGAHETE